MPFTFEHGGPTKTSEAIAGAAAGLQSFMSVIEKQKQMEREAEEFERAGELFQLQRQSAQLQIDNAPDAFRAAAAKAQAEVAALTARTELAEEQFETEKQDREQEVQGSIFLTRQFLSEGGLPEDAKAFSGMDPAAGAAFLKGMRADKEQSKEVSRVLGLIDMALTQGFLDETGEEAIEMGDEAGGAFSAQAAVKAEMLEGIALQDPKAARDMVKKIVQEGMIQRTQLAERGEHLQAMLGTLEGLSPRGQGKGAEIIKRAMDDPDIPIEDVDEELAVVRFIDRNDSNTMLFRFQGQDVRERANQILLDTEAGLITAKEAAAMLRQLENAESDRELEVAQKADEMLLGKSEDAAAEGTKDKTRTLPEPIGSFSIPGEMRGQGRSVDDLDASKTADKAIARFYFSLATQRWEGVAIMKSGGKVIDEKATIKALSEFGETKQDQLKAIARDTMRQFGSWK